MNEPAFPINGGIAENQCNGMTLRDYFAAKAMQIAYQQCDDESFSVMSVTKELGIDICEWNYLKHWPMLIAKRAYEYADAMLAARAALADGEAASA